ncbi:MAG: aldo/keto reductase [Clostridia bacterium]|nr:aldo/keto reductase [Clostridia bacterium]MBR6741874.1 aldo/keto reductase [Clostridia bacterium]
MNYRSDKYGNNLSCLGFGCMRFTRNMGKLDFEKAEREIMLAVENGVNYFDTAYIYPGSEALLGEIVYKNGIRDKINIATKLPHYLIKSRETLDKMFDEQLKRLRTDHVDYYLMHMLTDIGAWERMKELGIEDWIAEKKACGQIRQIGFSYHGNSEMFCTLVDAYLWDFAMIQYNYMDEHSQAGKKGLQYASSKGLAVMIMEPLRGGRLVNRLPDEVLKLFASSKRNITPAAWALKWLYDQPEVTVVLSGMNSSEMVAENIKTASESFVGELDESDKELLARVVKAINKRIKVGCTGCGYCVPCPQKVDIPGIFSAYNRRYSEGKYKALKEYMMCTTLRKDSTAASNCIGCGKCEKHCPQAIPIREKLKEAQKELEGPIYKIASKVAKKAVKF